MQASPRSCIPYSSAFLVRLFIIHYLFDFELHSLKTFHFIWFLVMDFEYMFGLNLHLISHPILAHLITRTSSRLGCRTDHFFIFHFHSFRFPSSSSSSSASYIFHSQRWQVRDKVKRIMYLWAFVSHSLFHILSFSTRTKCYKLWFLLLKRKITIKV